jgi:DNA invertase Pin-like site-specific DNA recombinase
MIAVLGGLVDVERDLIRTRTAEGRSRAKAQGKHMGRPPSRAGFGIADDQLEDEARRKIMRRVHEGAELRLTGGYADGSGESKSPVVQRENTPSNTGVFKSPGPCPPK